jgi:hypothetical protein
VEHACQGIANAGSGVNARVKHRLRTQHALKNEGHKEKSQDAESTRPQNCPHHVSAGILELTHVADGRLECIG